MGTQAYWGFRKDGIEKITYTHYDGYPDGVGDNFITIIKVHKEQLDNYWDKIHMTDEFNDCIEPIAFCKTISKVKYLNLYTSVINNRSIIDWGYIYDLNKKEFEIYHWGKLIKTIKLEDLDYFDEDI